MSILWDDDKKDQLLKILNETFYFHKDGSITRRDQMNEEYDIESCKKCERKDHEGNFCRCEPRNIAVAKMMRERGESPWNREMIAKDFGGNSPCAYLFCNGAGMYFDEDGKQINELQRIGLSGLHKFVQRYPEGEVHWSIWKRGSQLIRKDLVKDLLKYLREDVKIFKETETTETT